MATGYDTTMHRAVLCFGAASLLLSSAVSLQAHELGDKVEQPNMFTYLAPKGWGIDPGKGGILCAHDQPHDGFAANISVSIQDFAPDDLATRVAKTKAAMLEPSEFSKTNVVDEKPFETNSGIKGMRLSLHLTYGNVDGRQILYFFDTPQHKFAITGTCLDKDGSHYDPIFDASMKTFSVP